MARQESQIGSNSQLSLWGVMLGAPLLLFVHPVFFSNFRIIPVSSFSFFKLFLLVCGICVSISALLIFIVRWGAAWWRWKCYWWVMIVVVINLSSKVQHIHELVLLISLRELIRMFNFNIRIKLIYIFNFNIWIKLIRKIYMDQLVSYDLYGSTWSIWNKLIRIDHIDQ